MSQDDFPTAWRAVWGPLEDAFAVADWPSVETRLEQARALTEPLGPHDVHRGMVAEALARRAQMLGQLDEAEEHFTRAEEIFRTAGTNFARDLASTLMSWADLSRKRGKWPQARGLYERAITLWEQLGGMQGIEVLACLGRLGTSQRRTGDAAAAERSFRRAVRLCEGAFGKEHADTAWMRAQHADALEANKKLDDALAELERALAIYTANDAPPSVNTARVLHAMNRVYRKKGELAQAELHCQRALAMRETVVGPGHPEHLESAQSYAILLRMMNREDEARAMDAVTAKHAGS